MQYIYDHPELLAIIWPILTGLLSLAYRAIVTRFPVLAGVAVFLCAAGLDLPGTLKMIKKALTKPAPEPPKVDPQ